MEKALNLLISALLVVVGFGSVPECYVMKPHCSARAAVDCPLRHINEVSTQTGNKDCPYAAGQMARQQRNSASPIDRLARISLDQERQSPPPTPDRLPAVAVLQDILFPLPAQLKSGDIPSFRLLPLPPPPLLILLQKKSLLI